MRRKERRRRRRTKRRNSRWRRKGIAIISQECSYINKGRVQGSLLKGGGGRRGGGREIGGGRKRRTEEEYKTASKYGNTQMHK